MKKIIYFLIFIFICSIVYSIDVNVPERYYSFDTIHTQSETFLDFFNKSNATNNGTTLNTIGKLNQARTFNGLTDSINFSYVNTSKTSINMWIYVNSTTNSITPDDFFWSRRELINERTTGVYIGPNGEFCLRSATSGHCWSDDKVPRQSWFLFTFINIDGTYYQFWVNETKVIDDYVISGYNGITYYIGSNLQDSGFFNGTIDEFAIYDGNLTANDISYLYNNGIGRTFPRININLDGLQPIDNSANTNLTLTYFYNYSGDFNNINCSFYWDDTLQEIKTNLIKGEIFNFSKTSNTGIEKNISSYVSCHYSSLYDDINSTPRYIFWNTSYPLIINWENFTPINNSVHTELILNYSFNHSGAFELLNCSFYWNDSLIETKNNLLNNTMYNFSKFAFSNFEENISSYISCQNPNFENAINSTLKYVYWNITTYIPNYPKDITIDLTNDGINNFEIVGFLEGKQVKLHEDSTGEIYDDRSIFEPPTIGSLFYLKLPIWGNLTAGIFNITGLDYYYGVNIDTFSNNENFSAIVFQNFTNETGVYVCSETNICNGTSTFNIVKESQLKHINITYTFEKYNSSLGKNIGLKIGNNTKPFYDIHLIGNSQLNGDVLLDYFIDNDNETFIYKWYNDSGYTNNLTKYIEIPSQAIIKDAMFHFSGSALDFNISQKNIVFDIQNFSTVNSSNDGCLGNITFAPTETYTFTACLSNTTTLFSDSCVTYTSGEYGEEATTMFLINNFSTRLSPNTNYILNLTWERLGFNSTTRKYDIGEVVSYSPLCFADQTTILGYVSSDCTGGGSGFRVLYTSTGGNCSGSDYQYWVCTNTTSVRIYEGFSTGGVDCDRGGAFHSGDPGCFLSDAKTEVGGACFGTRYFTGPNNNWRVSCDNGTNPTVPNQICTYPNNVDSSASFLLNDNYVNITFSEKINLNLTTIINSIYYAENFIFSIGESINEEIISEISILNTSYNYNLTTYISDYLSSCELTENNTCLVPINFKTGSEAEFIFNGFNITYQVLLNSSTINSSLEQYKNSDECVSDSNKECTVGIHAFSETQGKINLTSINITVASYPENVSYDFTDDGIKEYNATFIFNQTNNLNYTFTYEVLNKINNYLDGYYCADETLTCDVPIRVFTNKTGIIRTQNITITYPIQEPVELSSNGTDITDFLKNDSLCAISNCPVPINVNTSTINGKLKLNNISTRFIGDVTYEITGYWNGNISHPASSQTINISIFYSPISVALPKPYQYFNLYTQTGNEKNVIPWGQTNSKPIYNISMNTTHTQGTDVTISLNETFENVTIFASNTSSFDDIWILNTSEQEIFKNKTKNTSHGLWIKVNFTNFNSDARWLDPIFYFTPWCSTCYQNDSIII